MNPTPIDFAIALGLIASILGACHRGLGREMLHTVMFAIVVAIGYVLFRNAGEEASGDRLTFWLVNSLYYLVTAYVLTWVLMKVLSPLILGHEGQGLRSRFWAGVLAISKLSILILGLNLWFAIHSTDVHPKRLESLPPILRNSTIVRISDNTTEKLYLWLARNNILEYHKSLERPQTEEEKKQAELEQLLGVSPTNPNPLLPEEAPPAPIQ